MAQSTEKEVSTQSTPATSTEADDESEDDSDFSLLDENGELRDDFGKFLYQF